MIEEHFHIRVAETDLMRRASLFPYAQRNALDQFAELAAHLFDCNCTLERATFTHEVKQEYLDNPAREHITHYYSIDGMVSAHTEEDMARLKAATWKETPI